MSEQPKKKPKPMPLLPEELDLLRSLRGRLGGAVAQARMSAEERSRRNRIALRTRRASMTGQELSQMAKAGGQAIREKYPPGHPHWAQIGKIGAERKRQKRAEREAESLRRLNARPADSSAET